MEQWKSLEFIGFPNYKISSMGKIRSAYGERKPSVNNHGYLVVTLVYGIHRQSFQLHRLVALAFILNPQNLPIVNHKNENKLNCAVDNLEWVTEQYNVRYSTAKLTDVDILWIKQNYKKGFPKWTLKRLADKFDCTPPTIRKALDL